MLERTPLLTENEDKSRFSTKSKVAGVTGLILMVVLVAVVTMGRNQYGFLNQQNKELVTGPPPILEAPGSRPPGATAPPPTRHICPVRPVTILQPPIVLEGSLSFALLALATTPPALTPANMNGVVLIRFGGGARVGVCNLKFLCLYNFFTNGPVVQLSTALNPSTTYELAIGYWKQPNLAVVVLSDVTKTAPPLFHQGPASTALVSSVVSIGPLDSLSMWDPVTNSPPTKKDVFICPPPPPVIPPVQKSSSSDSKELANAVVVGKKYLSFDQFEGKWPINF